MSNIVVALRKMKNGKAGGNSSILPEMIKAVCCQRDFMTLLLDLVHTVWRERRVPRDWSDAILIPIPKKGDLSRCDNWHGIALLEVVGKVVARVIQDRLQQLAESELPESQCGFRKGRGCSDMLFVLRQLMEKIKREISGTPDQAIHHLCGPEEGVRFSASCSPMESAAKAGSARWHS